MNAMRGWTRRGLTLVELLAVITIIGLLMALLLPTVQSVRESSRRNACCNNLKQVGVAVHGYVQANDGFPPALTAPGGLSFWAVILPYADQTAIADKFDYGAGYHGFIWELDPPACDSALQVATDLNRKNMVGTEGPGYMVCPSRRGRSGTTAFVDWSKKSIGLIATTDYALVKVDNTPGGSPSAQARNGQLVWPSNPNHFFNPSVSITADRTPPASWPAALAAARDLHLVRNQQVLRFARVAGDLNQVELRAGNPALNRPFFAGIMPLTRSWVANWGPGCMTEGVRDGLSMTAIIGEKHLEPWEVNNNSGFDAAPWGGGGSHYGNADAAYMAVSPTFGQTNNSHALPGSVWGGIARGPDEVRVKAGPFLGSWHPGVCNFLMADGAVRPIDPAIPIPTLASLGHATDGHRFAIIQPEP